MSIRAQIIATLQISCRSGGQASNQAARRQRLRRQAPLLPFERKLEEQKQKEMKYEGDERQIPIEDFLPEPSKPASPRPPPETARAEEKGTLETVDPEIMGEEEGTAAPGSKEDQLRTEIQRKARALMEIIQAGAGVEEAISRHSADIDDTMIELLQRRMDAARQLERSTEVTDGMAALQRRLKAEMDRRTASTSMRLLDSLLAILDEGEEGGGLPGGGRSTEVQQAARAKLRSAFGGAPLEADVLAVAAQLAMRGQSVADELLEDVVDAKTFVGEVTALLDGAMEQQQQLVAALEGLAGDAPERPRVEEVMNERAMALNLVQEVLTLTRAVQKDM